MKTTRITQTEMEPILISSLPTRPTAPTAFGGKGYTATEMKAAFDKLPTLIVDRFNALIDDIEDGEVCKTIPTGLENAPTLTELLCAFTDGRITSTIILDGTTLAACLDKLRADVDLLLAKTNQSEEAAD